MTELDVVVAEDDPGMRALLAHAVERAGFAAVPCATGTELMSKLIEARAHDLRPALILSDERMPGCTGLTVAAELRSWGWSVPFVLVTAFPDQRLRAEAASVGIRVLLAKPVALSDVTATVARLARAHARCACNWCGATLTERICEDCFPTGVWAPDVDLGGSD